MASKFSLGTMLATPGALDALRKSKESPQTFIQRHASGDWGEELCSEDRQLNEQALLDGDRLLSAYKTALGSKLWVITEADRSATTVLLPEEY